MDKPEIDNLAKIKETCEDMGWDYQLVLEMVILALEEKRFTFLTPSREEWETLRNKPDAVNILSKKLFNQTGRQWAHEEIVQFKNHIETIFFKPARKEISFETQLQLLFNREQKCALCGAKDANMIPEMDHKKPSIMGGSSEYFNIQWLCRSCNRKKQA